MLASHRIGMCSFSNVQRISQEVSLVRVEIIKFSFHRPYLHLDGESTFPALDLPSP